MQLAGYPRTSAFDKRASRDVVKNGGYDHFLVIGDLWLVA
jgi:hypothetical protein